MKDIIKLFKKLEESHAELREYSEFRLRLKKPITLKYIINGFLKEKKLHKEEVFNKKLNILNGIESNFSYVMYGDIQYPYEFKTKKCIFSVNDPSLSDYLEYSSRGLVGDGYYNYKEDEFSFNLYISPQMAKDIIDRRILEERIVVNDFKEYDYEIWGDIRINVSEFHYTDNRVWFSIVSIYC